MILAQMMEAVTVEVVMVVEVTGEVGRAEEARVVVGREVEEMVMEVLMVGGTPGT